MLIYLDSVILIYFHDHVGPLQVRAANRLFALRTNGDRMVVSDLVRLECRVMPIRRGDVTRLAAYDRFLTRPDVETAPLTTAVYDRATDVRARYGFTALDAINLAAAVEYRCDRFLTNDVRLARFPDVAVEILP